MSLAAQAAISADATIYPRVIAAIISADATIWIAADNLAKLRCLY